MVDSSHITKKEISNMMFTFRLSGVYTTRNESNELSKRSMKPFKVSDIIKVVHYEKDYDFLDDGSSCHHNQFCKE